MDTRSLRVGNADDEHVTVTLRGRKFSEHSDYWDGNWVRATIEISVGAFRGEYDADLRCEDFVAFRDALRPLYETLSGSAKFETMERWLSIVIDGDGRGHLHAECVALDAASVGNRLHFGLDFDQTSVAKMLRDLDAIAAAFPVVGALTPPRGRAPT